MATWISVIPAFIVLAWAITTHNVIVSLVLGIASAAFIAFPTDPISAAMTAGSAIYQQITSYDNILVFAFLICIGIIITLMQRAGAIHAYVNTISSYITTSFRAEIATLFGAFLFFLDDYLNAFTLGSMMAPIFDKRGISRTKLAYLLNASISPLCILIPATTWTAMILSQLNVAGIGSQEFIPNDPYATYLSIAALALYPILSILTAYYITTRRITYGKLADEASPSTTTSQPSYRSAPDDSHTSMNTSLFEFIIPMLVFISSAVIFFLYLGDATLIGGSNSLVAALQAADSSLALALAAGASTTLSCAYFYWDKSITSTMIPNIIYDGYMLMQGSLIVLLLAWSLNVMLIDHLQTASYLADVFTAHVTSSLLPLVIFMLSSAITASTGSAWGTIALMIPLTARLLLGIAPDGMPILLEQIPYAYPTLAAVLSGAVAGGHISPITDATVVASSSSGSHHMTHVISQIQYSIPPIVGTICGYIVSGIMSASYTITWITCLGVAIAGTWITLHICQLVWHKRNHAT